MDALTLILLAAVAFAAGAINAVAGGGSLISFPALVAAGYESKTANVTNTVALWPGFVGGSVGYREELRVQRRRMLALAPPAVVGAIVGAVVLLATPAAAFDAIVPFLILFACAVLAFQDQLAAFAETHHLGAVHGEHVPPAMLATTFVLAIYGAYFGAGMSIIMLALLGIFMPDDIQRSNALKVMLAALINAVAVVYFALFGPVRWGTAAVMAVGAILGGYIGAHFARRLGRRWLRGIVLAYGVTSAIVLLLR